MGKIQTRVYRKDQAVEDHAHQLPDGTFTGGMLLKPNSDRSFPHTHLYQHEGKTYETGLCAIGGDHTHVTVAGMTSGPVAVRKDAQQDVQRNDSVNREGMYWVRRSITGHVIARGVNRNDVMDDVKKKDLIAS